MSNKMKENLEAQRYTPMKGYPDRMVFEHIDGNVSTLDETVTSDRPDEMTMILEIGRQIKDSGFKLECERGRFYLNGPDGYPIVSGGPKRIKAYCQEQGIIQRP